MTVEQSDVRKQILCENSTLKSAIKFRDLKFVTVKESTKIAGWESRRLKQVIKEPFYKVKAGAFAKHTIDMTALKTLRPILRLGSAMVLVISIEGTEVLSSVKRNCVIIPIRSEPDHRGFMGVKNCPNLSCVTRRKKECVKKTRLEQSLCSLDARLI